MPHTPGPWRVYDGSFVHPGVEAKGQTIVILSHGDDDAGVRGATHEEALANAHLIAAAPDLLAAGKAIARPSRAMRAAIAKAEAR